MKAILNMSNGTEVTIQKVQDVSQKMRESLENYRQNPQASLGLVWLGGWEDRFGLLVCQMLFAFSIFQSELR